MALTEKALDFWEKKQKEFLFLTSLAVFLLYIYEIKLLYHFFSLRKAVFILWLSAVFFLKLKVQVSLLLGFACLGLTAFFLLAGGESSPSWVAIFAYSFFWIGIIQELLTLRGGDRNV